MFFTFLKKSKNVVHTIIESFISKKKFKDFVTQNIAIIMKVLLEIPDNKADFGLEVLRSLVFVKNASPISAQKYVLMKEIKEAVEEFR